MPLTFRLHKPAATSLRCLADSAAPLVTVILEEAAIAAAGPLVRLPQESSLLFPYCAVKLAPAQLAHL